MAEDRIELQGTLEPDVQGHIAKYKFDAKGDDVSGHGLRFKGVDMEGEDSEGHALRVKYEDTGPEADVEGHFLRYKVDVEGDDVGAHLAHLEGAEVTGKDAEGSAWTLRFDRVEGDDVQAHLIQYK